MSERHHWHPVADACALHDRPMPVQLLGESVVLWRDAGGHAHAWGDQCPHRGAQLSLGRVVGNRLVCGYHGWQFEPNGQCAHVPARPEWTPPAGHCARVYEAQEACGLVWVRLSQGPQNLALPLPAFEPSEVLAASASATPAADSALPSATALAAHMSPRILNCGPFDVATSAPRVVENFLDMAHFGFVHEGWLGSASATHVPDYAVAATPEGFAATGCVAWQPQSSVQASGPARVEYRYDVIGPYTAVLTKVADAACAHSSGFQERIALLICPITPERSRVWFRMATADLASTDAALLAFQQTIFEQDRPVLESQVPKLLPLTTGAECHSAADKASAAYRQMLTRLQIRFGTC